MTTARLTFAAALLLASGCAEETPPYSVEDFLADRILLQATMVRCGQDQSAGRHDPNCVAAREAVDRIAAAEARAQREALEAESERKREALRRARDAAEERRRLAEEEERRRREAEEFGIFEPPPGDADELTDASAANEPVANGEPADAGAVPSDEPVAAPDIPQPTDTASPADPANGERAEPEPTTEVEEVPSPP